MSKAVICQDRDCAYIINGSPIFYTIPAGNSVNLMLDLSGMTPESDVTIIPASSFDFEADVGRIKTCDTMQECINTIAAILDSSDPVVWVDGFSGGEGEW